ncbi:hypothetical protein [Rhizobium leguminosarum]|uniref:hypothetical protein n=1 Tax=Rhizobium leguminosarum TaxID=384 RepID=UPI001C96D53C|nr:hypothetical protein [Rhizobium leguminosarum]MBY5329568.1 hypothetical protein [Rhizobium leguminosarum]
MPEMFLSDNQAKIVIEALTNYRGSLMCEWGKVWSGETEDDGRWEDPDQICDRLDARIVEVATVRRQIQDAVQVHRTEVATGEGQKSVSFNIDGETRSFAVAKEVAEQLEKLARRF